KCTINETGEIHLGSPLLALITEYPFTDYYFVDMDLNAIQTLQQRCCSSVLLPGIKCLVGDCNKEVAYIVDRINEIDHQYLKGQWQSLNLAFLDPEGLELEWNTIAALAGIGITHKMV
ncbi:MAG: hypothetical protein JXA42_15510, partial [Anaerolineales bacterium]|nr:hypothetical protein [Anaerolineales bacterium]